jgi:small multidrug resistance pump
MNSTLITLLITLGLTIVTVLGDVLIKHASDKDALSGWKYLLLGALVYVLSVPGWFLVLRKFKLSTSGALFCIFTIILLTLASVFYFKEKISVWEIIGILMAIASVAILYRFA